MSNQVIHTLPVPINPGLQIAPTLRERCVTEQEYEKYLCDVQAALPAIRSPRCWVLETDSFPIQPYHHIESCIAASRLIKLPRVGGLHHFYEWSNVA